MSADYACVVDKGHPRQVFGEPQTPAPLCCGKPLALVANAAPPVAPPAHAVNATATKPSAPTAPGAPRRTSRKSRKGAQPQN
jgi:hypothetical protein